MDWLEGILAISAEAIAVDGDPPVQGLRAIQDYWFGVGGPPSTITGLKITVEQRKRFMEVVQEMQKKIEPLMKEAQSGGDREEIRPKVIQIRKDHEGKLEALLTDAQKKQWKEMLGKPLDLGD